MEKKSDDRIKIPDEDVDLANVMRAIYQDFNGDAPAFFQHVQDSWKKTSEANIKEESSCIKKFIKNL